MDVTNLTGDTINGSIHDKLGFKKDGKDSVGVKRQYLVRPAKIENSQMGVFLGYANGNRRNDPIRRKKCGVPEDIVFSSISAQN